MILQFSGLSGAGKTTIAEHTRSQLLAEGITVQIIDGDVYRKTVCSDLSFSKADRLENIRRLGMIAASSTSDVVIIAAINPYEEARRELKQRYNAMLVWINCDLEVLYKRDTKGLYKRAELPDTDPGKIRNFTGVSDTYETPQNPDLVINTHTSEIKDCCGILAGFIKEQKSSS